MPGGGAGIDRSVGWRDDEGMGVEWEDWGVGGEGGRVRMEGVEEWVYGRCRCWVEMSMVVEIRGEAAYY